MKNPLLFLLRLPVLFYRTVISPLTGPRCRFYPTCSAYALQAFERHGAIKGAALAIKRFLRCHPWSCGQFDDPVPKQFTWRAFIGYNRFGTKNAPPRCGGLHEKGKQDENV